MHTCIIQYLCSSRVSENQIFLSVIQTDSLVCSTGFAGRTDSYRKLGSVQNTCRLFTKTISIPIPIVNPAPIIGS